MSSVSVIEMSILYIFVLTTEIFYTFFIKLADAFKMNFCIVLFGAAWSFSFVIEG